MKLNRILFVVAGIFLVNIHLNAANAVWWEGEDAVKSDFVQSPFLSKLPKMTRLSNMNWLSCYLAEDSTEKKQSYSAEYEINVPEAADYTFWAREFYRRQASPWKFRFDEGEWVTVNKDHPFLENSFTELGTKRSIVWCKYGNFNLTKGKHKLEIVISEKSNGKGFCAGFDCFLLTDTPFTPNAKKGWKKPDFLAKYGYIGTYVWLEGEDAETNFENKIPGIPEESTQLSKNKWLICTENTENIPVEGFTAKWKFIVPNAQDYHVWVREFRKELESPIEFRFNNASRWEKSLPSAAAFDQVDLGNGNAICWVNYQTNIGKNTYKNPYLREGENTLEIRITQPGITENIQAAIDCISISMEPFSPAGKLKPDTKIVPEKGWRVFRPKRISQDSKKNVLSLRHLNEKRSGSHGFCRIGKGGVVFEDGTKVKFWGINAYEPMKMNKKSVDSFVSHMADLGVNLIRIQGTLCNPETHTFGKVDARLFDKLCYFIKACKNSGIYVALANYTPSDYLLDSNSEIEGFQKPGVPYGLLYINKKYRETYKQWATFLKRTNPYTGLKLYKDPTIAWFEITDNEPLFLENFEQLPAPQKKMLETEYNKWLVKRHGGFREALYAWSMPNKYHPVTKADELRSSTPSYCLLPPDSFKKEILTGVATNFMNKRKEEQMVFLINYAQKVNKELMDFLRTECHFKGLISLGNSKTAAQPVLGPALNYIYSSGDIIARNSFFKPDVIDNIKILSDKIFYQDRSALKHPLESPIAAPSFTGKVNVVTAVNWPQPNKYRAEAVPCIAAYSALHGSDIFLWSKADSPTWTSRLRQYTIQDPAIMGAFPAAALMFRRGDVAPGKTVVTRTVSLADIVQLQGYTSSIDDDQKVNPLAILAGKVEYTFTEKEKGAYLKTENIDKLINTSKGFIKSTTGELISDFKNGRMLINTPRAQGVSGFFKRDIVYKLKDTFISLKDNYGTVLAVSLDDKPIVKSEHILVQFFSEESNYQWKISPVPGKKFVHLDSLGDSPVVVRTMHGYVSFPQKVNNGWIIRELDVNGNEISELQAASGKSLKVTLPAGSFYIELKKR